MAENRFAKYLDQQPATNRFAKYAEAEAGRDKVFSKGGSALVGMGDMGTFGLRDEAAGGQAARQSMLPDWLNRGLDSAAGGLPIVQAGIGAIDAAIGITTENTGKEGQKSYDDMVARRDNQRAINSMAQTDNPLSYLAGGVVGSVAAAPIPALGVGKTVGGTMAKVGLEGAAFGGAMGFGSSEGDLGDRAKAGGEGAVIGGAAGAVLGPVAQYVLGPVIKGAAYKAFTPDRVKALDQVLIKAEQSGTSLDDVKAGFEKWSATGEVPEVLAEIMGAQERGLLSAVVTESAASRETAAGVLLGRGRNEVNILERGFAKAMNAKGEDLPKAVAAANKARSEDPEAFYAPAHFAKDGSLKPLRPDQQSNLNNILVEEDDVVRILKDAQSDLNRSGNKSARDEVRLYREAMAKIQKGEPASLPTLSVQAGDYIERSINQSYKAAYGSSGTVSGSARGWRNQRDAVRAVVDDGTGIAEARSTAAERIRRTELLDEGRKFLNPSTDVEDVRGVLRGDPELDIAPASPEGRTAYTAGAARGIRDKLQNVPDMKGFADATRAIARTPAVREKIAAVLPQETVTDKSILAIKKRLADGKKLTGKQQKRVDEYGKNYDQKQNSKQTRLNNELDDTIERVANRSDFTTNMLGNSRTAFRQADADAAAFDGSMQAGVGRAVNDLISNGPAAAQARGWQKLGQAAEKYIARPPVQNPKINAEMARILLAQGEAIPEQLQRLAARQLKRGGKPNPTNALAIGAGKAPAAAPKGPVRGAGFVGGKAEASKTSKGVAYKAKSTEVNDSYKGEMFGYKELTDDAGKAIAAADINIVGKEVSIRDIVTRNDMKRKGLATALVEEIQKEYPGYKVTMTNMTDDGSKFIGKTFDVSGNTIRGKKSPKDPARGAGFMLPEKTGRPIGFHDDMPRGTKRFNSEKLTDSQNKSVEMARNGYSNAEIAEEMEISANAVSVHLRNARMRGVDYPASKTGKQPTTRTDILRAAESGAKATAIAERLGISPVQVRVTLSRARKAVKEAGDDVPEWLKPQTAGIDVGSELSQLGVGTGVGAQGAQDIDGDGKISLAERAAGAAAGYGVIKGGPRAIAAARNSGGRVARGIRGAGSKGRPELPMDEASRMARAKEMGDEGSDWYTGANRLDRLVGGGKIDPKRATSGPMPYFTDAPDLANSYTKKMDNSLRTMDDGEVKKYFTATVNGRERPVEDTWFSLSTSDRKQITENYFELGYKDFDAAEGPFVVHPKGTSGAPASRDHMEWVLKQNRGNPLAAIRDLWHDGGMIFGDESKLIDLYKTAGYPNKISDVNAPWVEKPGVMKARLMIKKPLKTSDPDEVRSVLERLQKEFADAPDTPRQDAWNSEIDPWDKRAITGKQWVEDLAEEMGKGDQAFVWTRIPDEITNSLRKMGYDGIIDASGKGGGPKHRVAIPFDAHQVRSKFAKFDPDESNSPILSAGFDGRKPPKKRLGRGLDSLMDDAAPVRSPASKTTAGNALAPQPRTGADWTEAERKAFINSGHEEGLIPIEPDSSFVTVKAARKSIKKLGIDYRVGDTNDYESGFPVLASVLGAGGVTAGTLGLLSAYLNQRPKSNVPPEMAKARAKLADTAATAYQKDPNGDEFRNTMIRLQQMDRKIEGGSEAEPRSPSYKPRKLSPSPAGITGEMLKRAGQKTGNALAMTEGKLNTGAERAADYVRDRLRTAELPKRPIDLLKESEMKRNRQGQFVRDMETKRANDALWQRNGYTGYRGRKMTPAELRAQGKGSR
jgi:DNA-binding CsgD family transcriptional regulator